MLSTPAAPDKRKQVTYAVRPLDAGTDLLACTNYMRIQMQRQRRALQYDLPFACTRGRSSARAGAR